LQQLLRTFGVFERTTCRNCLAEAIATATEMAKLFNIPVPQGNRWRELVDRVRDEIELGSPSPAPPDLLLADPSKSLELCTGD
jgi:hypothetical protein